MLTMMIYYQMVRLRQLPLVLTKVCSALLPCLCGEAERARAAHCRNRFRRDARKGECPDDLTGR